MTQTRNDLPQVTRSKVADLLNARLADTIDLHSQTKQAHWNVQGQNFIALHELFDQSATTILAWVDELAERALQLGNMAHGTVRTAAQRSVLAEYPSHLRESTGVLKHLCEVTAKLGAEMRRAITLSDDLGDAATADLFTGIVQGLDKILWFYEAHIAE